VDEIKKKIIVKIAAGLGNQMFMYANAFSLAKKINYELYIDTTSGFFQKKNRSHNRVYKLNKFNIIAKEYDKRKRYDNYFKHFLKKIYKFINNFKNKKSFIIEKVDSRKKTSYKSIDNIFSNKIYIEGYFESEKYFINSKKDLLKQFTPIDKFINTKSKYIKLLEESNSISLHVRRDRFIEPKYFTNRGSEPKKDMLLENIINYIMKGVDYFEKKITNPKFFLWSNNFSDLDKIFNKNKFIFIENNDFLNDFHLFSYAKHFIVSPSSFHWWGAWLNQNPNKICVRPENKLNPSNNDDYWPSKWIKID